MLSTGLSEAKILPVESRPRYFGSALLSEMWNRECAKLSQLASSLALIRDVGKVLGWPCVGIFYGKLVDTIANLFTSVSVSR